MAGYLTLNQEDVGSTPAFSTKKLRVIMFGWRKSISNLECDIIAVEGYLSGLNYRLNSLIKINSDRYQLDDEIKRVQLEIEENEIKLSELRLRLDPSSIG